MPKCLLCKKELKIDENGFLWGGGCAVVDFGYGSRHDQLEYAENSSSVKLARILSCNRVEFFLCDDCFEGNLDLFEGYDVQTKVTKKKKT
jgi:hypothetical protein